MLTKVPTPHGLLDKTATVEEALQIHQTSGWSWVKQDWTLRCNVQPASSFAALQYQRETNKMAVDIYFDPEASDGVAHEIRHYYRLKVAGVYYRVEGDQRDPITNGCIGHVIAEVLK